MKKKERLEIKKLIDLLIRCDKELTYHAEEGCWNEKYTLFRDLEQFGVTELWSGHKEHSKTMVLKVNESELTKYFIKEMKHDKQ